MQRCAQKTFLNCSSHEERRLACIARPSSKGAGGKRAVFMRRTEP